MLTRLAALGIRAPKRVLLVAGLLLVLGALVGAPVASHLSSGGFDDTGSASSRATRTLNDTFHAGDANLILAVHTAAGADSAAARSTGTALARHIAASPYASQVIGYWNAPAQQRSQFVSRDGDTAILTARISGDDDQAPKRAHALVEGITGPRAGGVTVTAGGVALTYYEINHQVKADLTTSEMIAIPLTTIALILIFGSLFAALLPVAVGIASIIGTMAILRGLAAVTHVSIFALNMTTALGLALAIDYSLFVVNRYREEVRAGRAPADAVTTTMQTAGRTVLFSALTVGLSLAAMLVFPLYFLRSFAYAGIAVVALATVAALVLLPAVLTLIGTRIDALDLRRGLRRLLGRPKPVAKPVTAGFWYRFAHGVMKRAVPVGILVVAVLVALGLPFLKATFGFPDERVLPPSASAHQVGDELRDDFAGNISGTVTVVVEHATSTTAYATQLSTVAGVTAVSGPTGTYAHGRPVGRATPAMTNGDVSYLQIRTTVPPNTDAASRLLDRLEAVPAPGAASFTGLTAQNRDSLDAIGDALPWALLIIIVATFLVLFLFTGSLVLPLKALVLNTLSLSATFGAMVWIFQEGHLHWLFPDLTVTGHLEATMPPLMFCLAFGLSMDYEVFLLSRIREAWLESDRSAQANVEAVALGLGRTGRIVTAAAALMAIVFAAIAGSSVSFMMTFGTGLTLAVLMDATVVRGMLVPAFMRLAGRWNWWAPRPLARLHERIGLHEGPSAPTEQQRELVHA